MQFFNARKAYFSLISVTLAVGAAGPAISAPKKGSVQATAQPVAAAAQSPSVQAWGLIQQAYGQMRVSNWPAAVNQLCTAISYDRNNVLARRYLCFCLLQAGSARDALSQLEGLDQLNHGIPFDECMKGEAYVLLGETDKGIDTLKNALSMDPTSDYIRMKLIDTMQSYARYQEAAVICSEGYFAAKTSPVKMRYLTLYNTLQQQRALLAQRTLGIQIATTTSYPMMAPPPHVAKQAVAHNKDAQKTAQAADDSDDSDEDEDTPPADTKKK